MESFGQSSRQAKPLTAATNSIPNELLLGFSQSKIASSIPKGTSEPALMLPYKAAEGDEATNRKLNDMLRTEPRFDHGKTNYKKNIAANNLAMWRKLKPLTVENFLHFWDVGIYLRTL